MNQVMTIFLVLGVIVYSVESSLTPSSDIPWEKCRHDCFAKYMSCQMSDSCHNKPSCRQCQVTYAICVSTGCP
uniref:U-actitoxin-Aeq5b n=1 Tax=Actinia equina TaxID=6106 RepID=ACR1A_ACTEQ|nr:RecName: Full=U-actitoxin-Aeq5b; Short=U-AITX-Aeq5b; AltName: Full=Acrorhagin Ia; AltName: Full=Acrorhagin-1a; Flags: Precursor [Actinia equina]ATY39989.1 U-actitoxin-Ate1a acrorhagin Ia [Actinia tenebrosa]BAE46982.1 acrorhagin Ia [Actinia equina]